MNKTLILSGLAFAAISMPCPGNATVPPLTLDLDHITVSGLSSGGYMANQLHLAYSDWIDGVGIIAAGPYFCAQNAIATALSQCVNKVDSPIDLDALSQHAETLAEEGKLAALDNLKNDKVWLFHGTRDNRVTETATDLLAEQYANWVPTSQIVYIKDKPFAHLFPTKSKGGNCSVSESPFIGHCDYDAAGEMLNHLYGTLEPKAESLSGEIISFSQQTFAGNNASTLADKGYAYVPKTCNEGETCRVHVSLHGCNQYAEAIDTAYVENTGLNEWADTNHLVVVYPQTTKSRFMPLNPQGCWDWWGYTGEDYATRDGEQIIAIKDIVKGLASN